MIWLYITFGAVAAVAIVITGVILFRRRFKEYKLDEADRFLVSEFRRCNVMVFGKKGSGKDVIFAHVIALRGEKHYANIPYDDNTEVIDLYELNVGGNTFKHCIDGNITPFPPRFDECCDVYISDGGIYLPSHFDKELEKIVPDMPSFFALSRHLYNNNVHINSQAVMRPWKKLREQADSYIQVLRSVSCGDCLLVSIKVYDKLTDAENEINPTAKYTVRVPIGELQYDSRYFRNVFLDRKPSERERIMCQINRRINYGKPTRKKP